MLLSSSLRDDQSQIRYLREYDVQDGARYCVRIKVTGKSLVTLSDRITSWGVVLSTAQFEVAHKERAERQIQRADRSSFISYFCLALKNLRGRNHGAGFCQPQRIPFDRVCAFIQPPKTNAFMHQRPFISPSWLVNRGTVNTAYTGLEKLDNFIRIDFGKPEQNHVIFRPNQAK